MLARPSAERVAAYASDGSTLGGKRFGISAPRVFDSSPISLNADCQPVNDKRDDGLMLTRSRNSCCVVSGTGLFWSANMSSAVSAARLESELKAKSN